MSQTTDTYLLLRAFVDELARCGLAGACTSPGSRSTPLVLTLARQEGLATWSHVDERCAGFFALGVAKATGRPAAVACTSGTAAANYLPAVIEAREARVPLVVLTTDRPPELRDVGAGQTIDQIKLYGDAVKWFVEVGTHAATPERLRWMRALACRAVWTALDGRPGPVHLNLPLREPLVLDEDLPEEEPGGGGRPDGRPWVARSVAPSGADGAAEALAPIVGAASRGVVVAGRDERGQPGASGRAVAEFAAAVGWPLLADPLSGARRGPAAIAHWDLLLRHAGFADATVPDVVLRVGDLPTSKSLRAWLGREDVGVQVVLDAEDAWQDPASRVDLRLPLAGGPALAAAVAAGLPPGPPAWLDGWRAADVRASAAIADAGGDDLTEIRVAAELSGALPASSTLFVAASMPIRDVETFFGVRDDGPRVLANRGANGIDGTTSTAFGVAAGSDGPVVALMGDVTLAHDLGGLLAAHRLRLALTIVVVDNGGGGIFDFLAVASQRDAFEEHVATPTGLDPAHVAQLFGLDHRLVRDVAAFRAALNLGLASDGVTLIEVRSDRQANVRLHRRVSDAVMATLSSAGDG